MRVRAGVMVAAILPCLVGAACRSTPPAEVASAASSTVSAPAPTSASTSPEASTSAPSPVTTEAVVTATTASPPAPTPLLTTPTTTTVPELPDGLDGVGSARQAIVVTAASSGSTTATFRAYERAGGEWEEAFGPWTARVGYNGIAPAGAKREGDGRTPSGVYGFGFMFGVSADPGVSFSYRRVTPSIVWDDDSGSPLYNQWVDRNEQSPGAEPEEMYQPTAYAYGAVIAYNAAATPGLGSAIFLHASTGGATAGCVSLPVGQLVDVLTWLDPARSPRIVIRVAG